MDFIEAEGKTKEEAVERGLRRIGAEEEEVEIEALESLGEDSVKVRIAYDRKRTNMSRAKRILESILAGMDMNGRVEGSEKEDVIFLEISSDENKDLLIGPKGDTINALQYIVNRIINKDILEKTRVVVDIANYREGQKNRLEALARSEAERVKETGESALLPPMNPEERRIIHITLKDDKEIETASTGTEPNRGVVISLKKKP